MKYVTEIKDMEQKATVSLVQTSEGVEIHVISQDEKNWQKIGTVDNNGVLKLYRMNFEEAVNLGIKLDCGRHIKTYQL